MNVHIDTQTIPRYELHPYCSMFPEIDTEMGNILSESIAKNGQYNPIKLFQGKILDGRARYTSCYRLNIMPKFEEFKGTKREAFDYAFGENMARRHLTTEQRAFVANKIATLEPGDNARYRDLPSQVEVANMLNISRSSIQFAKVIVNRGIDALVRAVTLGEISLQPASEIAKLDPAEQEEVMAAKDPKKAFAELKDKPTQQFRTKLRTLWEEDKFGATTWREVDKETALWFVSQVLGIKLV